MVVEGGHGGIGNLQLLGGGYNSSKRDGTQEYLVVRLKKKTGKCMLAGRRVEIGLGQTVACWKKLKQIRSSKQKLFCTFCCRCQMGQTLKAVKSKDRPVHLLLMLFHYI